MIKDGELPAKYKISDKVSNTISKGFISEPIYNDKCLKTKLKSDKGKINTKLSHCIWLSVILIDSVFRMGENYYPQVFLEECKYIIKEKNI